MDRLLDFYRLRFGQAVKRQGNGWNGPCPICGGEPGLSDRFMVWPDRDDHLGEICAENRILGIWSCRKCGASGDTIAYLIKCEGLDFKAALGELGIEGGRIVHRRRRAPVEPKGQGKSAWQPQEMSLPSAMWHEAASKIVDSGQRHLTENPAAVQWLASRGLDETAIAAYRLGWLPPENAKSQGRFRPRSTFGLESKTDKDGKTRTKLFIPRGIVVPSFDHSGQLLNVRIRRHREDLREGFPKYLELEGSSKGPLVLAGSAPAQLAAWVIVEAELDAMLIHHATGGKIGAVAVRTNRGKPDTATHRKLLQAARILVALDFDEAGTAGVDFWEETYQRAMRWPTPAGKDPGEAFALGVDIREWIAAGLPACIALDDKSADLHGSSVSQNCVAGQGNPQNGQLDPSSFGQSILGGGDETQKNFAAEKIESDAGQGINKVAEKNAFIAAPEDFNAYDLPLLQAALERARLPMDDLPLDVARLWLVWRHIPAVYDKAREDFMPQTDFYEGWRRDYTYLMDALWEYPNAQGWLNFHRAAKITPQNLFNVNEG